ETSNQDGEHGMPNTGGGGGGGGFTGNNNAKGGIGGSGIILILKPLDFTDGGFYTISSQEVALPTKPTLTSPSYNANIKDTTPTFQWTNGENHANVSLILSTSPDFSSEHINISLSSDTTSYTTPAGNALTEGRWYWRVVANNSQGTNSSTIFSFIVDTTPPHRVTLDSPANDSSTDSNAVTFSWLSTSDNTTNTTDVSGIKWYQLQVDTNNDFSNPLVDANTSNSATLSLTQSVTGRVFWRVRAWDNAGSPGAWSEVWNLTIFSYTLTSSESTIQIKRGESGSTKVNVSRVFGDIENVTLSYSWVGSVQPNGITTSFSKEKSLVSFDSTVTFTSTGSATTGSFTCIINATSESGINRSLTLSVTVYSMLFSLDAYPRSLSLIRNDVSSVTFSVSFDQGALNDVTLSGSWIENDPSGVTPTFSVTTGTPNYDSTVTFTTTSYASAGSYTYRVTATSAGLSKIVNIYIEIATTMTLTLVTDSESYERGQEISISGTAKDPNGNNVQSGTTTINIQTKQYNQNITTPITNGQYNTNYYITFDKPLGEYTLTATGTDTKGHTTETPATTTLIVNDPEIYDHYHLTILNPTSNQLYKRGETIPFTVTLTDNTNNRIQNAAVNAYLSTGEKITFTEASAGTYTTRYNLGYDFPTGTINLYVEAKIIEEGKLKVGFNYIEFTVEPITPQLQLITPKPGDILQADQTIIIQIKATYPDGTPVNDAIIKAYTATNDELIFRLTTTPGTYTATYTPTKKDIGTWTLQISIQDSYGNMVTLSAIQTEIVHSHLQTLLIRYWWITTIIITFLSLLITYTIITRLRIQKFNNIKKELYHLEKLKKKNAINYFSQGEITRETYDKLTQEYESKIAKLSKKERLLSKKIQRKKSRFNKYEIWIKWKKKLLDIKK
ncbi:MAG: hypothetical protein R6V50_06395, partial [Thermoplasmatota archaeon]